MESLRDFFLLDPDNTFLNHGSFGACPRPVFQVYQAWQYELERQPVEFLDRRAGVLMADARRKLGDFIGAPPQDLVFFPNPTTAVNMVVRSLAIGSGDEILTTNHEYGAMDRTWRFICRQTGARYVHRPIPLPVTTPDDFLERFWDGVTPRTRVIFISHITSQTALTFPVEEICQLARQAGILTIVDGAHAPGQIPLDMQAIGADLYTGACHKWLMGPKGAAFLYARPEVQDWLDPLVVSWGYEAEPGYSKGSQYIDYHEWQGTRDLASFLSVPAAIEFQQRHNWKKVRRVCHNLARETRARINELTGLEPICPDQGDYQWYHQMFSARLPQDVDIKQLKSQLYDRFQVEAPVINWNDQKFLRISFQGYNTQKDADKLLSALQTLLPNLSSAS